MDIQKMLEEKKKAGIFSNGERRAVICDIQVEIGRRLEEVRKKHGINSHQAIADKYLECSTDMIDPGSVSRWERGDRRVDLLYLIWFAQEFSVDLHWLITGERKNQIVQELTEKLESALELSRKL